MPRAGGRLCTEGKEGGREWCLVGRQRIQRQSQKMHHRAGHGGFYMSKKQESALAKSHSKASTCFVLRPLDRAVL